MHLSPVSTVSHIDFTATIRFFNYSFFFAFVLRGRNELHRKRLFPEFTNSFVGIEKIFFLLGKKEHFKVTLTKCMKTI